MTNDATVKLGIDARPAAAGDAEFRRSADSIKKAAASMAQSVDRAALMFDKVTKEVQKSAPAVRKMTEEQRALKKIVEDTLTPMEKYQRKAAEIERLRPFAKTEQEVQALNRAMSQAERQSGGFFNSLRGGMSRIIALAGPFAAAFSVQSLIQSGAEMQALRARLEGLTGSAEGAVEAMDFLKESAARQKIDLLDLASAYSRLLPSVDTGVINMKEMRTILTLTNDSIKAFRLGSSEAQGVFLGLSQALGSGTVTMEDLRQVTDRLPGTLSRIAASAGVSVNEFKKMVAQGNLTADMLKGPLIDALSKNAGAAEALGSTFDSVVVDIKNAWRDFGDTLSDTGILTALSKIIQTLSLSFKGLSLAIIGNRISWNLLVGDEEEALKLQEEFVKKQKEAIIIAKDLTGLNDQQSTSQGRLNNAIKTGTNNLKADADAKAAAAKATAELKTATDKLGDDLLKMQQDKLLEIQKLQLDPQATNNLASRLADIDDKVGRNAAAYKNLGAEGKNLVETLKRLTAEHYALEKAQERAKKQSEEMTKALDHAWENIQDGAADMVLKFEFSLDSMVDIAKKAGAEIATALIIKPALAYGAGSALNALGFAQTAFQVSGGQVGQEAGSGGIGASTLASGASTLSNLYGGSNLIATGLDKLGFLFGIGDSQGIIPTLSGNAAGGLSSYSSFTNGSWGGGFGASAAGFAGNFGANLLLGNRGIGADIGGTIGAIAGSFIPVPILGPLVGSFLGNAIGGLFGNNKPSSKLQAGTVDLFTGELVGRSGLGGTDPNNPGKKFSQENYDAVTQLTTFAAQIANVLSGGKGLEKQLTIEAGNRNGIGFNFGNDPVQSFGGDKNKFVEALIKQMAEQVPSLSKNLETAIKNIDFSDAEKALKDLDFALQFDNLSFAAPKATALESAIKTLNEQVNEAAKTARRLGLEEAKIYEARDKQLNQLRSDFNAGIRARTLGIENPEQASIEALDEEFKSIRRDALAVGADMAAVERLYGLERVKIAEQYAEQATAVVKSQYEDIRRFRESILTSSSVSGLSPENRRAAALSQFETVKVRFANDDATFSDVQDSINTLLDASKDYYGFSEGYYKDQAITLDYLSSIENQAKRAQDVQLAQLNESKTQTSLLTDIKNGLSKQLTETASISQSDPRLFRAGETFEALSSAFNTVNQLPESLVRQFKVQTGFNFNDPANATRSYAEVATASQKQLFNQLVSAVGGTPQFATGGSFVPGMALVGEDGPELINFQTSGRVLSNAETRSVLSAAGTGTRGGGDSSAVVAAMKEAAAEIRALREQNAAQTEQLAEMSARLGAIEKVANRQSHRRPNA